jgi:outer membrane protein, multidrug efflux system
MRNLKIESISIVLASFLLGGCVSLAPDYERPTAPMPSTWKVDVNEKNHNAQALAWEAFIRDERLQSVIRQSLEQSRDLRKAIANIEAARATYRIQRSAELPTLEASASGSKARTVTTNNSTAITQSSSATLGISSYELDFFGKVRNASEAEFETYKGVEEAERLVRLTLIAETTTAWLTYASDQTLLTLSKQTEQSAKRSFELVQKRVELGIDSNVSLYSAQSIFQQAKADVASYTTKVAQDLAALELLVGASVDETRLPTGLESTSQLWLSDVPVGLSSSVLLNRPDVLEAEHNLKSANANIGVARAAYFPSITLTSKGGVGSSSLTGLFNGGTSTIWSFVPNVNLPLFDAGEREANLDYAKAKRDLTVATYELAIQTAFKEVNSALARRVTMNDQLEAQKALVEANTKSYAIYDARYQKGVDTYLNALLAQRSMYASEQNLISVRLEALLNRVTLYQVLGGDFTQKSE